MAQPSIDNKLVELLKDNGGWMVSLFKDQNKITTTLCHHCNNVCCDAVELGCDHDDNQINLYCNDCLQKMITNNQDRCPIDSHDSPSIISARSIRKLVLNSMVYCIHNIKCKQNDDAAYVVDTSGNDYDIDEKEGLIQKNNNNNNVGCKWVGKLNGLLSNHLVECTMKNNPLFAKNIKIKELETENKKLNGIINIKDEEIKQLGLTIIMLKNSLTATDDINDNIINITSNKFNIQTFNDISHKLQLSLNKITKQNDMIKDLRNIVNNVKKENNSLKKEISALKGNKNQLNDDQKTNTNKKVKKIVKKFKWNRLNKGKAINITQGLLTKSTSFDSSYHSAFSMNSISYGRKKWKIQITQKNGIGDDVFIGIIENPSINNASRCFWKVPGGFAYHSGPLNGYVYKQKGNKYASEWKKYGSKFKICDIITVHVDCDLGTLAFSVNDDYHGIIPYQIKKNVAYHLAVALHDTGDSVLYIR